MGKRRKFKSSEGTEHRKGHPRQALSAVLIKHLNEPGYYCDGNGLYLQVSGSGSKSWIVRTAIHGKRREIGIGGLAYTTLAEARDKAFEIRKAARSGGDPLTAKREAQIQARRERRMPTFEDAAREVHREREKTFTNALHKKHWIESLETFAFPILGSLRVDRIESAEVLRVLTPIWLRIPETARRVKQRIEVVLQWARAAGHRDGANPVEGIEEVLPRHNDADKHHAALPYAEVPAFIQSLRSDEGVSGRLAFEFLILTASRTIEVCLARWVEIDFEAKTWTRPASHMKARREHKVPLTARTLEILEAAKKISDGGHYIFPGLKAGRPRGALKSFSTLLSLQNKSISLRPRMRSYSEASEARTRIYAEFST